MEDIVEVEYVFLFSLIFLVCLLRLLHIIFIA